MPKRLLSGLAGLVLAVACGDEPPGPAGDTSSASLSIGGDATRGDDTADDDDDDDDDDDADDDDSPFDLKFDVGPPDVDPSAQEEEGCTKVDFLFVIDNSNSMATNQGELIASFPEFVTGIESTLTDVDSFNVGVVTSDAYAFNGAGCNLIGAVVTETGGVNSSNAVCDPFNPRPDDGRRARDRNPCDRSRRAALARSRPPHDDGKVRGAR